MELTGWGGGMYDNKQAFGVGREGELEHQIGLDNQRRDLFYFVIIHGVVYLFRHVN